MLPLTKKVFKELADYHGANCVSIYLPTHRAGMEVNRRQDEILLKNQLKDIANQLETLGFSKGEIENHLQPAYALLDNSTFWNNLSDGLALFIGDQFFRQYTVPADFEAFTYIADHFYLKPLMPIWNDDAHFYLLALSLEEVRFFEGTQYHMKELHVKDITPNQLEEVVGYDYKEKSLQFHSAQRGAGKAMYHGHGENSDEDKNEIKRFFKGVNDGLMNLLRDETAPLVVACVDYLFPIFKEANTYKHLHPENISGSPYQEGDDVLHQKAWQVLEPAFKQMRDEQIDRFRELVSSAKAASQVEDIIPAALNGKVEILFAQKSEDAFGLFNPATQEVRWDEAKQPDNAALLNLAAIKTFEQGGKVFLLNAEEMPVDDTLANAIFRF